MTRKPERKGRGRKVFWALVVGAALIAGVGLVQGVGHGRAGFRHDRQFAAIASPEQLADRLDHLLDHLDATDAQRTRIVGLVDELAPELAELAAQRDVLSDQIVAALASEELPPARAELLQQRVSDQSARLAGRTLEIALEFAAELTPEQRTVLIERWQRR